MKLYHRTRKEAAGAILQGGFKDSTGNYLTTNIYSGVWLSNTPLDENEGACGDVLLEVTVEVSEDELAGYEWIEEEKPYREWLVPASFLNPRAKVCVVEERRELRDWEMRLRWCYDSLNKQHWSGRLPSMRIEVWDMGLEHAARTFERMEGDKLVPFMIGFNARFLKTASLQSARALLVHETIHVATLGDGHGKKFWAQVRRLRKAGERITVFGETH